MATITTWRGQFGGLCPIWRKLTPKILDATIGDLKQIFGASSQLAALEAPSDLPATEL
jgi:hypothetical protein